MSLPSITSRYRVDNMVKNGIDGGFPVGSLEAKSAIDRVGRALHGKGWRPASEGIFVIGREKAQRKHVRRLADEQAGLGDLDQTTLALARPDLLESD